MNKIFSRFLVLNLLAAPSQAGTLLQTDFEVGKDWANVAPEAVGTIDVAGPLTTPSLIFT